jgi:uncharacterized membrane protein
MNGTHLLCPFVPVSVESMVDVFVLGLLKDVLFSYRDYMSKMRQNDVGFYLCVLSVCRFRRKLL